MENYKDFNAIIKTTSSGTQEDFLEVGDSLKVVLESGKELKGLITLTSPLKIYRSSNGIIDISFKKKLTVHNNMKFYLYGYNHKHIYGIIANGNFVLDEKRIKNGSKSTKEKSSSKGILFWTSIIGFFSAIGSAIVKFIVGINWGNIVLVLGIISAIAATVIISILIYKAFGNRFINFIKEILKKIVTFFSSKNNTIYHGGLHGNLEKIAGCQKHHMPPWESYLISKPYINYGELPAIHMDIEDHKKTLGWGNPDEISPLWDLMKKNKYKKVVKICVKDVKKKFGHKYDKAINEFLIESKKYERIFKNKMQDKNIPKN